MRFRLRLDVTLPCLVARFAPSLFSHRDCCACPRAHPLQSAGTRSPQCPETFRVVLTGNAGVGKTSLFRRYAVRKGGQPITFKFNLGIVQVIVDPSKLNSNATLGQFTSATKVSPPWLGPLRDPSVVCGVVQANTYEDPPACTTFWSYVRAQYTLQQSRTVLKLRTHVQHVAMTIRGRNMHVPFSPGWPCYLRGRCACESASGESMVQCLTGRSSPSWLLC